MHADFHSEAKHGSLNNFRVTMDTARATSAGLKKKNGSRKTQAHTKKKGQQLFMRESVCSGHKAENATKAIHFPSSHKSLEKIWE